jgi:hypothetical protein
MAKATSTNPAFSGIRRGDLTGVSYLKDGQMQRAAGKVIAFNDTGTQILIERVQGLGRIVVHAKHVAAARQAEAEAARAAAPRATDRQVTYALALLAQLGPIGWHNSDAGQMRHQPDKTELSQMAKTEISQLIDRLRFELGVDDF